jgi:hypothetical protein
MTDFIGSKGGNLDLLIRQGTTLGPNTTQLKDRAGAAINITGATIRSEIRKTPDDAVVKATAVCTITDAANGTFTWSFTAAETKLLTASPIDEEQDASKYVWDMEIQYSTGRIQPLMYGVVKVFREVTKEA